MSRTSRPFWLIADDYGLSPGVCRGILQLAAEGRLSGTGCMTLFADWPETRGGCARRSPPMRWACT